MLIIFHRLDTCKIYKIVGVACIGISKLKFPTLLLLVQITAKSWLIRRMLWILSLQSDCAFVISSNFILGWPLDYTWRNYLSFSFANYISNHLIILYPNLRIPINDLLLSRRFFASWAKARLLHESWGTFITDWGLYNWRVKFVKFKPYLNLSVEILDKWWLVRLRL